MARVENVHVKINPLVNKIYNTGVVTVIKNNGKIVFTPKCTTYRLPRQRKEDVNLYTVKVYNNNNKVIYTYYLNYNGENVFISNMGWSNNTKMEEYIIKQVEDVIFTKLNIKSFMKKGFTEMERVYFMKVEE